MAYLVVRLSTVDQQMTVHRSMAMAVMEKEEMRTNTAYRQEQSMLPHSNTQPDMEGLGIPTVQ
jgi:hypothetical protein